MITIYEMENYVYSDKVESQTLKFPAGILANFLHIAEMIEELGPNLRIPINSATQSNVNRPPNPMHSGHPLGSIFQG